MRQISPTQGEAREGREQTGPAQSRTALGRRRSLPFQLPLPSVLLLHTTSPGPALFCHRGQVSLLLGPVSSSVKWEVGRLHHLPGGRPRGNPVWVGFGGAWRLRKRSPHPDFESLLLHRYCFKEAPWWSLEQKPGDYGVFTSPVLDFTPGSATRDPGLYSLTHSACFREGLVQVGAPWLPTRPPAIGPSHSGDVPCSGGA